MTGMNRLSWAVAACVIWTGSVSYAQSMQTNAGSTPGGNLGSTGGGTGMGIGAGVGTGTGGRSSNGLSGPRLGTSSDTVIGLGNTNRINRSTSSPGQSPLGQRGSYNPLSLSGDASQQQGGANRQFGQPGVAGFNQLGGQQNRSGLNQNRQQNQRRAQYSTRMAFPTPSIAEMDGAPGVPGIASDESGAPGLPGTPAGRVPSRMALLQESLESLADSSIHVAVEGDAVVLRGTVAGESDRRVAERMAKLEPGVSRVRNELVVASVSTPK